MRKIEQQMLAAIKSGKNWKSRNTEVRHDPVIGGAEPEVYLHGHLIAKRYGIHRPRWEITLAGWNTATTRSRLSAIVREFSRVGTQGLGVSTNKGQPYLHDVRGKVTVDSTGWHKVYC